MNRKVGRFNTGDARAEIVESYDARKIGMRVSGVNRRDFMTIITEEIDKINGQYEKMKVDKMIPCNCAECQTSDSPHFYEYKDLRRRLEKGRAEVECANSYEMVNVRASTGEQNANELTEFKVWHADVIG